MTVVAFPVAKPQRIARLVGDEQRVSAWYEQLDGDGQDEWFSLHEIRAATGVPLARLPAVLRRLWFVAIRVRRFGGLTLWHGPNGTEEGFSAWDKQ